MTITTEQDKEHQTQYVDPASISLYINDLIVGMLETGKQAVTIQRGGHRFPYFGCYTGSVIKVSYLQLVNRLKAMTETMELGPQGDTVHGFFMVIIGPEEAPAHIRFNVEVGANDTYLSLTVDHAA